MANVEEGVLTPDTAGVPPGTVGIEPGVVAAEPVIAAIEPVTPGLTRTGKPSGPAFTRMHHDEMDSDEDFEAMLGIYDSSFRNMAEGEVVKGTVLTVTDAAVVVDVGYKSEGLILLAEFIDGNGQVTVQPGDIVDVLLERTEDREGHIVLSREKAEKMKIWDEVEQAYAERKVVIGRGIERI